MYCIDLIITDQINLFIESGVHPSLDAHYQQQIIYGKLKVSIPVPPPFNRIMWDYAKADTQSIRDKISGIDWKSRLMGLDSNGMTEALTPMIYSMLSLS